MLEITVDVFSGRPNPSWFLPDERETRDVLKDIAQEREMVQAIGLGYQGLGFRGIHLRFTQDGLAMRYGLPPFFQVANPAGKSVAKGLAVGERLIHGMTKCRPWTIYGKPPVLLDGNLQQRLLASMHSAPGHTFLADQTQPDLSGVIGPGPQPCDIETRAFDPDFWNDPAHVRLNNCYNYATNRRNDHMAQPGDAGKRPLTTCDCADVTDAALADGAKRRGDCCTDSEKPRWLIALVVDPSFDFHWYRLHSEGFWGHKPGTTAAKNTDNNGHTIFSPELCAREPYTEFCGYFYAPAGMQVA